MDDVAGEQRHDWSAAPAHPRGATGWPPGGVDRPPDLAGRLARQLTGIDSWNAARRVRLETIRLAAAAGRHSPAAARRLAWLQQAHDALLRAAGRDLDEQPTPLLEPTPTAVIADRHPRWSGELVEALSGAGVAVLLCTDDAALALGTTVAEQPDLLVCGQTLEVMTGPALLAEAALFSPDTLLAAYVDDERLAARDAGVTVFIGRDHPHQVASQLSRLLHQSPSR